MEAAPARGFDVLNFDVLKGALRMRLNYLPGWAILCGLAIAGLLTGLASSYMFALRWEASASFQITPQGVSASGVDAQQAYDLAAAQNELMRRIQMDLTSRDITIIPQPWPLLTPGYVPRLTFHVADRGNIDAAIAKIAGMSHPGYDVTLLGAARRPRRPVFPNRPLFALLGLVGGSFAAALVLVIRNRTTTELSTV